MSTLRGWPGLGAKSARYYDELQPISASSLVSNPPYKPFSQHGSCHNARTCVSQVAARTCICQPSIFHYCWPKQACRSYNRIHTPAWRCGPDGASTVCNACGLHYAKLERKCQLGTQSLRPKTEERNRTGVPYETSYTVTALRAGSSFAVGDSILSKVMLG